ncbi:hypothetical protein [Streptomonospora salina]|uniref:Uncharacterized protein n=1 Tax=Streptomonospora salina TaxID=104205 RepID=A0A841E772_9ACTN|nr:hypothetical protein [Streptomonospora salina]MBB5996973.1 hypothetical protein [Streptomonospora salina]
MWFMTFFPPARMLEFVLGIVIALIVIRGRWFRLPFPVALLLPAAPLVATAMLPGNLGFVALTAVPLGFLVAAAANADITGRGSFFSRPTMVFLGETPLRAVSGALAGRGVRVDRAHVADLGRASGRSRVMAVRTGAGRAHRHDEPDAGMAAARTRGAPDHAALGQPGPYPPLTGTPPRANTADPGSARSPRCPTDTLLAGLPARAMGRHLCCVQPPRRDPLVARSRSPPLRPAAATAAARSRPAGLPPTRLPLAK